MFPDTEANDHNQRNVFKQSVVNSRKNHFIGDEEQKKSIHFDSTVYFDIEGVLKNANEKIPKWCQELEVKKQVH